MDKDQMIYKLTKALTEVRQCLIFVHREVALETTLNRSVIETEFAIERIEKTLTEVFPNENYIDFMH